ncbi:MAG: L,D-transpeptidase, partial [Halothece sp. Uz-M2-17]|nr:L,D-transpeptidase [Halothece sp. Uz-M2-17]
MNNDAKKVKQLKLGLLITSLVGIALTIPTPASATPTELTQKLEKLKTSEQRWLEVDLSEQMLTAWQGGTTNYSTIVSTGKVDTPT